MKTKIRRTALAALALALAVGMAPGTALAGLSLRDTSWGSWVDCSPGSKECKVELLPGSMMGDAGKWCNTEDHWVLPDGLGDINFVEIDGKRICFPDAMPGIDPAADRALIPLRALAEIGFGLKVEWLQATKTVRITGNGKEILMPVDSKTVTVNGQAKELDAPARLYAQGRAYDRAANGFQGKTKPLNRVYVPVRFVMETFGATVAWDPSLTVKITRN